MISLRHFKHLMRNNDKNLRNFEHREKNPKNTQL